MDVTCNRCGAEYEFEETIISDRGTTVKCTNCGHLFKVFHPRTPFDKSLETKPWLIRKTNGLIEPLESLAELTRLIAIGHYREGDEISRTSQVWKRLGDISELQSFFELSRRRTEQPKSKTDAPAATGEKEVSGTTTYRSPNDVRSSDAPTRLDITSRPVALKKDANATTQPPRRRAETINMWSSPPPLPREESHDRSATESKEPQLEKQGRERKAVRILESNLVNRDEKTKTNGSDAKPPAQQDGDSPTIRFQTDAVSEGEEITAQEERRITPVPVPTSTLEKPEIETTNEADTSLPIEPLDENSKTNIPRFTRRRLTVFWIIFFTIIAAGVWVTWSLQVRHPQESITTKPLRSEASESLEREASAVLARYRLSEFEEFTKKYARDRGYEPYNKSIEIGLSRINAVWAQTLRYKLFEQSFFKSDLKKSERSNPDYVESQIMLFSDRAKLHAEQAMQIDPSDSDAQIALSDALRLSGDLTNARIAIDKVSSTLRDPTAEFLRVSALLTIDESQADYSRGLELAKQAVEKDPDCLHSRFLLAYCRLAANETKDARLQVDEILKSDSEHPRALALARLIDSKQKRAALEQKSPPTEIAKKPVSPPRKEKSVVSQSKKATKKTDPKLFAVYLQLGEEALENGNIGRAQKMFESALEIRPDAPRAETGLGFVNLEKGRVNIAIKRFWNAVRRRYPEAYIGLGDAYRQIERKKKALSAYENYARLRPKGRAISIAKRQINQLREQLSDRQQTKKSSTGQSTDTKKGKNPKSVNRATKSEKRPSEGRKPDSL